MRKIWSYYNLGKRIGNDVEYKKAKEETIKEISKNGKRTDIINYFLKLTRSDNYLEIGINNPAKNFDKIQCINKTSVDPGYEYPANPADFKITSDEFFKLLNNKEISELENVLFDVIFIDGLHVAPQVEKDIFNALEYLKDDGFLILHDCNPPTEYHQRENNRYLNSPARDIWNGTTWKAFYKFRHVDKYFSICFDCDWGVAVISKKEIYGFNHIPHHLENSFFEFTLFDKNRKQHINLFDFFEWRENFELSNKQ